MPIDIMHSVYLVLAKQLWEIITGEFKDMKDDWMLVASRRESLGRDVASSTRWFPTIMGRNLRNVASPYRSFKAEEWKRFWG